MTADIGCIHNLARNVRRRWIETRLLRQMKYRDQKGTGERYVTYLCTAGLGNRLAAHIAAHAYALRTGRQLVVSWIRNWHCGATFEDLFEPVFRSRATYRTKTVLRESRHGNSALVRIDDPPVDLVAFESRFWPSPDIHRLWDENAPHVEDILSNLRPRPEIAREVEKMAESFPRPIVGVHIRLGDFCSLGRAIPIERYIAAVERIKTELGCMPTCYVASDGKREDLMPFTSKFCCIKCNFNAPRDTVTGIREALIDLLLLARTDIVLQAPLSSFSNVAAFLRNVESIEV